MNPSITITEVKSNDHTLEKIRISGAADHEEAIKAAEEWCDENNSLLASKELEKPIQHMEDTSSVFYAKITSDDYD